MKQQSTRYLILSCLAILSICSFIYLQQETQTNTTPETSLEIQLPETMQEDVDAYMPDVALTKKIMSTVKRFLILEQ